MHDSASEVGAGRAAGVPVSGAARGARDQYEAGTVAGVSATGRYKVFATAFSARPQVAVSAIRSAGTIAPLLYGTPAAGSFRVRMDRVGSTMLSYVAVGAR